MVDRNDYKIIINKGKTKEKFFLFLTVGEILPFYRCFEF